MPENFEHYSATDWANDFLIETKDQFEDNESRSKFKSTLDKYHIKEEEAHEFLEAYKNGNEAIKSFLEERAARNTESSDHIELPSNGDSNNGKITA